MNCKRFGRKLPWPNWRYYPSICLEELRETMKNLSWCPRNIPTGHLPNTSPIMVNTLSIRLNGIFAAFL
jgi:hypothetical protein